MRCFGDNNDGSFGYGHEEHIGDDETPVQAAQLSPDQLASDVPIGRTVLALASGGRCAVLNAPAELLSSAIGPVRFE